MKTIKITNLVLVLMLTASGIWAQDGQAIRRFGLFVGTNDGGSQRQELRWAVSDAIKVSDVMSEMGGILPGDGMVLENPQRRHVEGGFNSLERMIEDSRQESRRVEFVFYYSGHSDETGLLLGDEHFSYEELRDRIRSVDADISIAILDSCASGAFTRTKGGTRIQPFLMDETSEMSGHAFITSSSADELAQESDRIEASFFTHYMISALRGAADHSGDRKVSLNEAYEYAFNETLSVTSSSLSGPQHPSYNIQLSGSGDLVLTDISNPVSSLLLSEEIDGRVFIRNGRRNIVAEINKPAAKLIEVALDPGIYHVQVNFRDGSMGEYSLNLPYRGQELVGTRQLAGIDPQINRTRGGTPEEPFLGDESRQEPDPFFDNTEDFFDDGDDFFESEEDFFSDLPELGEQIGRNIEQIVREAMGEVSGGQIKSLPESKTAQPTPEETAAQVRPQPALDYQPVYVGFVPGIGFPRPFGQEVRTAIGFSPLILQLGAVNGAAISGIMNLVDRESQGTFFAGIGNIHSRSLQGASIAGIYSIGEASVQGVQIAGVFSIAREMSLMAQLSGVFNVAEEPAGGAQIAGVFNVADHRMDGVQIAGVFNQTGTLQGVQIAGAFNAADRVNGIQISSVNVTSDANGAQIGAVNIASGRVNGFQLGVINIADDLYGIPIGLFSWVHKGIHDVSWWKEDDTQQFLGLVNGSRNFYTTLYAGLVPGEEYVKVDQLENLVLGFGWGMRMKFRPFYADLEASVRRGTIGGDPDERLASIFNTANPYIYPNVKFNAGIEILGIGFYLGTSLDLEAEDRFTGGYLRYNGNGGGSTVIEGIGTVHSRMIFGIRL